MWYMPSWMSYMTHYSDARGVNSDRSTAKYQPTRSKKLKNKKRRKK